jgi:hypothetical protein
MAQIPALNGGGHGRAKPVCARLADRDVDRLADLAERQGLLNMSAAVRLAIAAGLDQLDRKRARAGPLRGG